MRRFRSVVRNENVYPVPFFVAWAKVSIFIGLWYGIVAGVLWQGQPVQEDYNVRSE